MILSTKLCEIYSIFEMSDVERMSLNEAHAMVARLQLELHEKNRELDLYLHIAANTLENQPQPQKGSANEERLAREVCELRERLQQLQVPAAPALMPPPPRQPTTRLQGALAEINFAFDLLDQNGSGSIGRWELLRGMMDYPEVRGLLRLSAVADQAEFDAMCKSIKSSSGEASDKLSRADFEIFFMRRELDRSETKGDGSKSGPSGGDKAVSRAGGSRGGTNVRAIPASSAEKQPYPAGASSHALTQYAPNPYNPPSGYALVPGGGGLQQGGSGYPMGSGGYPLQPDYQAFRGYPAGALRTYGHPQLQARLSALERVGGYYTTPATLPPSYYSHAKAIRPAPADSLYSEAKPNMTYSAPSPSATAQ